MSDQELKQVMIVGLSIPFGDVVGFLLTVLLASIPVGIVAWVLYGLLSVIRGLLLS